MSVYVDELRSCIPNRNWRWTESCHLFADSEDELVAFARGMGLKKQWLQRKPGRLTHFDLTKGRRENAVKRGAVEVDARFLVEKMQEAREAHAGNNKGFSAKES